MEEIQKIIDEKFLRRVNFMAPYMREGALRALQNHGVEADLGNLPLVSFVDHPPDLILAEAPKPGGLVTRIHRGVKTLFGETVDEVVVHPGEIARRTGEILDTLGGEEKAVEEYKKKNPSDPSDPLERFVDFAADDLVAQITFHGLGIDREGARADMVEEAAKILRNL